RIAAHLLVVAARNQNLLWRRYHLIRSLPLPVLTQRNVIWLLTTYAKPFSECFLTNATCARRPNPFRRNFPTNVVRKPRSRGANSATFSGLHPRRCSSGPPVSLGNLPLKHASNRHSRRRGSTEPKLWRRILP